MTIEARTSAKPEPRRAEAPRRPHVLAVDDQRDSARLLQMQLRAAGIDCSLCYDGPSALEYVAQHVVDVIILDIMMPQMDGYEVCQHLKEQEQTRDIPVLFLTAKMSTEDKVQALAMGGHDYLTKPVQHQELLARTRAALRVKYLQDQLKEKLRLQQQVSRLHQDMLSQHWQATLGQLAESLAHEINNPLAIALGMVELLALEKSHGPTIPERLQTVQASLHRAAGKLRSLLLIAQSGSQAGLVDLSQLVRDVLALANYQILVSKVTLQTDLDQTGSRLRVPGDLARAVLALVNNAIEAVEGQPGPVVRVQVEVAAGRQVIRVSDNGPGLSSTTEGRIFEPFFTSKGSPHNGLGLSLAREIVERAGGSVEFQAHGALGGAEFALSLPVTVTAESAAGGNPSA